MNVRETTANPLYDELATTLRENILTGVYPPGSKIPSESELMEDTGLSRSTVRRALDVLVEEGLLTKERGRGAFVTGAPVVDARRTAFTSFAAEMARQGHEVATRTVDAGLAAATDGVAAFFGVPADGQLVKIMRLRYVDGEPFCLETSYFDTDLAGLIDTDLTGSLHRVLREVFHREPARGHKTFEVCFATQNEAFLLDVPKATPLMLVTDYVCDADGVPLYASKRVMRTDRTKYREPIG